MNIYQVDAFTDRPFAGNPAGVCFPGTSRDSAWMQSLAMEMNLSETAFLIEKAPNRYHLRWFTPNKEVDLCGHATLASAHVLWESGRCEPGATLYFDTLSGQLSARRQGQWIELDFPAEPAEQAPVPPEALAALGANPIWTGKNRMDYLLELSTEDEVLALEPDFRRLAAVPCRGFLVTARARGKTCDFISRCFFPAFAVDEDPVTGSAHCCLGPYWAGKLDKHSLLGYQASARGGEVRVSCSGERVMLGGQAVTVFEGSLRQ